MPSRSRSQPFSTPRKRPRSLSTDSERTTTTVGVARNPIVLIRSKPPKRQCTKKGQVETTQPSSTTRPLSRTRFRLSHSLSPALPPYESAASRLRSRSRPVATVTSSSTPSHRRGRAGIRTSPRRAPACTRCSAWLSVPAKIHIPAWKKLGLKLMSKAQFDDAPPLNATHPCIQTSQSRTSPTTPNADADPVDSPRSLCQDDDGVEPILGEEATAIADIPDHEDSAGEKSNVRGVLNSKLQPRTKRISYALLAPSDIPDGEGNRNDPSKEHTPVPSDSEKDAMGSLKSQRSSTRISAVASEAENEQLNVVPESKRAKLKKKRAENSSNLITAKGINTSLPPLNNIEDIFADLAKRALGLGLENALLDIKGRTINMATMCSGTESPLIAMELLSNALKQLGREPIHHEHHFSAEIDPSKQSYIELNFRPKRLYRDVRDFIGPNSRTATTAYGADEPIPGGIDILVAGFVCKDLSRLNNHQKGLDDGGESGDTWNAIYSYARHFRPKIVLIENVQNVKKFWDNFEQKWDAINYDFAWTWCDTKKYYLPQTRVRMYMIAIDRSQFGKGVSAAVNKWRELMASLQRPCSSPFAAFFANDVSDLDDHRSLSNDPNWALCKLRNDLIRSTERLGIGRPLTQWRESGILKLLDFANRKWYYSQSPRVYDCIDVAHLLAALQDYDSQYKSLIWDVSQNVDRFKACFGIISCITPNGINFVSDLHTALAGDKLLLLQGMPGHKLLFAKQTQRERQDLAGNAMTTTVIGASLIAAIIVGRKAFGENLAHHQQQQQHDKSENQRTTELLAVESKRAHKISMACSATLQIGELIQEAICSSRLCACEGSKKISEAPIQICEVCGHTACSLCAGRPQHSYRDTMDPSQRNLLPSEFERRWRAKLPSRLKFPNFPDLSGIYAKVQLNETQKRYLRHISEVDIPSFNFVISGFMRRDGSWIVLYDSRNATLELVLAKCASWRLIVKCPANEPVDSYLRKLLALPLARGRINSSLLKPSWELFMPVAETSSASIRGSEERTSSWRSRLGLLDYKDETVPCWLDIENTQSQSIPLGRYEHFPQCGTAKSSLYRSIQSGRSPAFLFYEQDLIGPVERDSFIFSSTCERLPYGETRDTLGVLEPSWTPWGVRSALLIETKITMRGKWVDQPLILHSVSHDAEATLATATALSNYRACNQALVILDVSSKEKTDIARFQDYAWMLEAAKRFDDFGTWNNLNSNCSEQYCDCAPSPPHILWSVDDKGATAREDRKDAARYERALKTRAEIFYIEALPLSTGTGARIRIGLNIVSLVHRAISRLDFAVVKSLEHVSTSWRLVTDHAELAPKRFPKLHLRSNATDKPYAGSLNLKYNLAPAQLQSLSWMRAQEKGRELTLVEVEEAIHPQLGWRAEAKAESKVTICGGVLADLPSFGKTVATIALIASELDAIDHSLPVQNTQPTLLDVAATLIVCPPHIVLQWRAEFTKFLKNPSKCLIRVIESVSDLKGLSVEDIRSAKVVIVSWNVFADPDYISHLASFCAMPSPATTKGRAFEAWLDYSLKRIHDQIEAFKETLKQQDASDFEKLTRGKLKERLKHMDFNAEVPIKIAHGSAYESHAARQAKSFKTKVSARAKSPRREPILDLTVPLLHMFRFNRIVIDEYHYLYDPKNIINHTACGVIKRLSATKRWLLSGTPFLANFSDVNQIASFLGVSLGRSVYGDGIVTTATEKNIANEQTEVERFVSNTETMSYIWHQARHQRAQDFLDGFVRQNEPRLAHISCHEALRPVELDIAHHAVYLELSHILIAQRLQLRRIKPKDNCDRTERLREILDGCTSAEEALLKCALSFNGDELDLLLDARRRRRQQVEDSIKGLVEELCQMSLKTFKNVKEDHYVSFKHDVQHSNLFGDDIVTKKLRKIVDDVDKSTSSARRTKESRSDQKAHRVLKEKASELRSLAHELTLGERSVRFIRSIQEIVSGTVPQCDSLTCSGPASDAQELLVISHCGHKACRTCLQARLNSEACVHTGCEVHVEESDLINISKLCTSTANDSQGVSFGKKLDTIVDLLKLIKAKSDQAIVFVPNISSGTIVEEVLKHHKISFHSLCKPKANVGKILEAFKTETDTESRKQVLVLNLGSEVAAGANLTNANHILFVSPLLSKGQSEYDSAMAQAIARCRRYGQKKTVHVYHFAALQTIDVDILEQRHKRYDALGPEGRLKGQPDSERKLKTKMVKTRAGSVALVPLSWLPDEKIRRQLGLADVDAVTSGFTSLIKFPRPLGEDDDE